MKRLKITWPNYFSTLVLSFFFFSKSIFAVHAKLERCDSLFLTSLPSIQVFHSEMFPQKGGLSFFTRSTDFNLRHFNPSIREEYYASVFEKLSSYYANRFTLTIVTSELMAKVWKKIIEKDQPIGAVVYLPDILLDQDLEVLKTRNLKSYRHLILVNPDEIDFAKTKVNTIIDLRPVYRKSEYESIMDIYKNIQEKHKQHHLVIFVDAENTPQWLQRQKLEDEKRSDVSLGIPSIIESNQNSDEMLTLDLPEELRDIGKPYFPKKIDLDLYRQLNDFFLKKMNQTDIDQILPKTTEKKGLYFKLAHLRFSYPLGWWMPLSPKVIRFLDQWHLKGKFQDAVDHFRMKELSTYIVEHQEDPHWVPAVSEKSELRMWFYNYKVRNPEWWKELQPQASSIAEKKLDLQMQLEKQEQEMKKQEEEQNAKYIADLDFYIQTHAQEIDPRFVLPTKEKNPDLKEWLDLRKKRVSTRKIWWKGLSETSIEILVRRHLILPVWEAVRKERYDFLSQYIIEHQSEKEDWKLFPSELGDLNFTKWLNEQVTYFPQDWAQPLSEEAREILKNRKLLKIKKLPMQDQNQINYRLLDAYIQSHAHESDVKKILPRTRESNELGDWLAHLKYHHPEDWWVPLSKESIEVLEKNYLKGSVQYAVERRRADELSQYILLHKNEKNCLPTYLEKSQMARWYLRKKEKGSMDWMQYLSVEALQILRERKIIPDLNPGNDPS
jgi:hypothetical protein